MDDETKQCLIIMTAIVVAIGIVGHFGAGCNSDDNVRLKARDTAVVECVKAGGDPLACKNAMEVK